MHTQHAKHTAGDTHRHRRAWGRGLENLAEYHKPLHDLLVEMKSLAGVIGLRKPRMGNVKLGRIE